MSGYTVGMLLVCALQLCTTTLVGMAQPFSQVHRLQTVKIGIARLCRIPVRLDSAYHYFSDYHGFQPLATAINTCVDQLLKYDDFINGVVIPRVVLTHINRLNGNLYEMETALLAHDANETVKGFNLFLALNKGTKRRQAEFDVVTNQRIIECKSVCNWSAERRYRNQWSHQLQFLGSLKKYAPTLLAGLERNRVRYGNNGDGATVTCDQIMLSTNWINHKHNHRQLRQEWTQLLTTLHHIKNLTVCSKFEIPKDLHSFLQDNEIVCNPYTLQDKR